MMMTNSLLDGNVNKTLIGLALPIMGSSMMGIAYNLTDMMWVGTISAKDLVAVSTISLLIWFMQGLIKIPRVGVEVLVSKSIGENNNTARKEYIKAAYTMGIIFPLVYIVIIMFLGHKIFDFFHINDGYTMDQAKNYLSIIMFGFIIYFLVPISTAVMTATGNSFIPFVFNLVGLGLNMVLDPLLISKKIGIFHMGVKGAAIATVTSQSFVLFLYFIYYLKHKDIFANAELCLYFNTSKWYKIIKVGLPIGLQSIVLTSIAMLLTRIMSSFGEVAIAAQNVTAQIEAISWLTALGFAEALTAFIGQNYGAKKYHRIKQVIFVALGYMFIIGSFNGFLLYFFPRLVLSPFFHEESVMSIAIECTKVMGFCQLLMCIEITMEGVFNGFGKTRYPALIGIIGTAIRYPLALFLVYVLDMGLNGVWWTMTISACLKGLSAPIIFYFAIYKNQLKNT